MGLLMLNGHAYAGFTEPAEIYSTEEREIGVWTDGKPLYQKTWDLGSSGLSISYNSWTVSTIPKSGMETIVFVKATNQTGGAYFGDVMVSRETDNTYISFQTARNNNSEIIRYVTLFYTKTTDTAGSGKWTTSGVPAHHYSTNEQVVGTWIDGKPLYERAYVNSGSDITANGGAWTTICSESWAQSVKQITSSLLSRQPYSSSSPGISTPCEFIAESGAIKINPFRNLTFKANAFFVIQYTKTTDQ